jgi:hypothetical protein
MTVQDKLADYYNARENYERWHELSAAGHEAMKNAEREAVDAMLNDGLKSLGLADGTHVSLRKQFTCSVTVDNEAQVREWLVEVNGDDSQFVVEKVHKPALVEWLRAEFEKTMDEGDVPDFMKMQTSPALSVRGWKSRIVE